MSFTELDPLEALLELDTTLSPEERAAHSAELKAFLAKAKEKEAARQALDPFSHAVSPVGKQVLSQGTGKGSTVRLVPKNPDAPGGPTELPKIPSRPSTVIKRQHTIGTAQKLSRASEVERNLTVLGTDAVHTHSTGSSIDVPGIERARDISKAIDKSKKEVDVKDIESKLGASPPPATTPPPTSGVNVPSDVDPISQIAPHAFMAGGVARTKYTGTGGKKIRGIPVSTVLKKAGISGPGVTPVTPTKLDPTKGVERPDLQAPVIKAAEKEAGKVQAAKEKAAKIPKTSISGITQFHPSVASKEVTEFPTVSTEPVVSLGHALSGKASDAEAEAGSGGQGTLSAVNIKKSADIVAGQKASDIEKENAIQKKKAEPVHADSTQSFWRSKMAEPRKYKALPPARTVSDAITVITSIVNRLYERKKIVKPNK